MFSPCNSTQMAVTTYRYATGWNTSKKKLTAD